MFGAKGPGGGNGGSNPVPPKCGRCGVVRVTCSAWILYSGEGPAMGKRSHAAGPYVYLEKSYVGIGDSIP